MDLRDRRLGMDRAISRRDFMNGVGVAVSATLLPACGKSGDPISGDTNVVHGLMHGSAWAISLSLVPMLRPTP